MIFLGQVSSDDGPLHGYCRYRFSGLGVSEGWITNETTKTTFGLEAFTMNW